MEQLMAQSPWMAWLIILLFLWTIPWKAMALWRAAKNDDKIWFIIFVVVNTVGILEIIYLFIFGKKKPVEEPAGAVRPNGTGFQKIV